MPRSRYVSTACVAEALGVSVTTVKRWVDQGILAAHKTVGGHRKILRRDVLRLVTELNLPRTKLHLLQLNSGESSPSGSELIAKLFQALVQGEGTAARTIILDAHQAGVSVAQLADEVIAPVMRQIGHDWAEGKIDVYQEHRGTRLCLETLLELKRKLTSSRDKPRPVALGGAPEFDHYQLPGLLVELVLLEAGWQVINLGPHTPISSFVLALREHRPQLFWLSVSHIQHLEGFVDKIAALCLTAGELEIETVIGGRVITKEMREQWPGTLGVSSLTELAKSSRISRRRLGQNRRSTSEIHVKNGNGKHTQAVNGKDEH